MARIYLKQRNKIVADYIKQGDTQVIKGRFNKALNLYGSATNLEDRPDAEKKFQKLKGLMDQAELSDIPSKLSEAEKKVADYTCKAVSDYLNNMPSSALLNVQQGLSAHSDNQVLKTFETMLKKDGATLAEETLSPDTQVAMKLQRTTQNFNDKKYDLVVKDCMDVVTVDPNNALAYTRLGSAYYALGLKEKALDAWRKALAINPNIPELQEFLREIKE